MLFRSTVGSVLLFVLGLVGQIDRAMAQEGQPASTGVPVSPAASGDPVPRPDPDAGALRSKITALLQQPAVAGAHWGIAVTRMDGTPVFALNETEHFRPASTAKLFTTAAAMTVLGPDFRVTTTITGDLQPATGTVNGDLNLLGAGDASFGTSDLPYRPKGAVDATLADLVAMADQVVAKGVRHVTGDIVGNDALFSHEEPPEGWAAEDLLWAYGASPSALSLGDNEVRLTVRPGEDAAEAEPAAATPNPSRGPAVELAQATPYLSIQSQVFTERAGTGAAVGVAREESSPRVLEVFGGLPAGAAPVVERLAVPDPAAYAAAVLRQLLMERGVQIDGEAKPLHATRQSPVPFLQVWRQLGGCGWAYPGEQQNCAFVCTATPHSLQVLATHRSAPLPADVVFTLKTSANLHAEVMLRQMGLRRACPGASAAEGSALLHTVLLHAGVAEGDVVLYDGSGLSTKDLVTPRSEAALLLYASRQPWFATWQAALPVGGEDGTLAGRFTTTLKGRVLAKTGTLGESRALAGFVRAASGQQLIFSVLDDNHTPGSAADRATMDDLVTAIAALN